MIKDLIKEQNCKVLLRRDIDHELLNDAAVGRSMDAIFEAGTQQVFSQISFNAISALLAKFLEYNYL